jgi:membrane protein
VPPSPPPPVLPAWLRRHVPHGRVERALLLIEESLLAWMNSQAPRCGAALAFYTFFSLTPLMMMAIAVAGAVFGREAAQGRLIEQLGNLVGHANALSIQTTLEKARAPGAAGFAAVAGLVTLLFGSTGAFVELQDSLNRIWGLPERGRRWLHLLRSRAVSFCLVLASGLLLLASLVASTLLAAAGDAVLAALPGADLAIRLAHLAVSLGLSALLFAVLFKVLPDVHLAWKDVWVGGLVTAVLFTAGRALIGAYLGRAAVTSIYGAASAVVLILLWTYYSALILYFGAEFTHVYSMRCGTLAPDSSLNAEALPGRPSR